MLAILVPALWIIFDVLICVRTGYMTAPFSRWEWWAWLVSGIVLALLAVIAGWWDRKQAVKEATRRHEEIQTGQEALAQGSIAILQRLAAVTQTTGQPDTKVFEAATARIEELSEQLTRQDLRIAELKSQSRNVTNRQYEQVGRAFPKIVGLDDFRRGTDTLHAHIVYPWQDIEAANYAQQLGRLFGSCGIALLITEGKEYETLNSSGIALLVSDLANLTDREKQVAGLLKAAEISYRLSLPPAEKPDPAVTAWGQGKAVMVRVGWKG